MDTILWDNDGVLVETEGLYYRASKLALESVGFSISPEQYRDLFLEQNVGTWHFVHEHGFPEEDMPALRSYRNDLYTQLIRSESQIIDGVRETLEALHGRFRMGIATSSRRDHFEVIHESTGLLDYFDFVITADEVSETKPNPELYLKGLELAGRGANECVVVEDSLRGLNAAHAAGIPCYVIPTEWTRSSDFSLAEAVLENTAALVKVLNESPTRKDS